MIILSFISMIVLCMEAREACMEEKEVCVEGTCMEGNRSLSRSLEVWGRNLEGSVVVLYILLSLPSVS